MFFIYLHRKYEFVLIFLVSSLWGVSGHKKWVFLSQNIPCVQKLKPTSDQEKNGLAIFHLSCVIKLCESKKKSMSTSAKPHRYLMTASSPAAEWPSPPPELARRLIFKVARGRAALTASIPAPEQPSPSLELAGRLIPPVARSRAATIALFVTT